MIRSMTGFGKAESKFKNGRIAVEIKTINHKFFDAGLKLPNGLAALEDRVKESLQRKIGRGKVTLNITYDGAALKGEKISLNKDAAYNYFKELSKLSKQLGIRNDITAKDIIVLPGVMAVSAPDEKAAALWPQLKIALDRAVGKLLADREKEGKAIYRDLILHVKTIERLLKVISSRTDVNREEYRKRFAERVRDLTGGKQIDAGRLEMEVAIFAKNSDIAEEIARLKSHMANFVKTISVGGDVGKKIDFIAQELHREANTVGSKASDFRISQCVIEIKGEIEKIREQAKNLE